MIAIAGEWLIGGIAGKERRTGKSACATEGEAEGAGRRPFIPQGKPAVRKAESKEIGRVE